MKARTKVEEVVDVLIDIGTAQHRIADVVDLGGNPALRRFALFVAATLMAKKGSKKHQTALQELYDVRRAERFRLCAGCGVPIEIASHKVIVYGDHKVCCGQECFDLVDKATPKTQRASNGFQGASISSKTLRRVTGVDGHCARCGRDHANQDGLCYKCSAEAKRDPTGFGED